MIIAGDLYDRAVPPTAAVELFDRAFSALRATGAMVVAISGNHDSASRVGVTDRLLNAHGVAVRGQVARLLEPMTIAEPFDGGPPVAIYLIPFLDPATASVQLEQLQLPSTIAAVVDDDAVVPDENTPDAEKNRRPRATHDSVMRNATALIRDHLSTQSTQRSIIVAHTFVSGGTVSESERALSVGDIDVVGAEAFDGFDLVTLGHVHRPQNIAGERVAYSGTPLAYSFSEEGQVKSVRLINLATDGSIEVESIPIGCGRELKTLHGSLDELLADPALEPFESARIRARLTDRRVPLQAMAKLRERFPHAVEIRHEPLGLQPETSPAPTASSKIRELTPLDLALQYWSEQHGGAADNAERDLLEMAISHGLDEVDT